MFVVCASRKRQCLRTDRTLTSTCLDVSAAPLTDYMFRSAVCRLVLLHLVSGTVGGRYYNYGLDRKHFDNGKQ